MEQTSQVDPVVSGQIKEVIAAIDGQAVVDDLLELAAIGGEHIEPTDDHPIHIATNRLALTEADMAGRDFVKQRMDAAGMDVRDDHPLAVIGMYPGLYEDLDPVVAMSHTDTVPGGDIYDGTLGVLGALKAVEIMHERDVYPERDTYVVSVSLEESSRFGSALRGSRALFQGLTAEELDIRKPGDQSIREALGDKGAARAGVPEFGPNGHMLPTPYALVELHVEQSRGLIDQDIDLGVVHSIASPVRYQANVGEQPVAPDCRSYAHETYYRLIVQGEADHSGATPMGPEHRADGLLATAKILDAALAAEADAPVLAIGSVDVKESAMNKIPGETTTTLRVASDDGRAAAEGHQRLVDALTGYSARQAGRFSEDAFTLQQINKPESEIFFDPDDMTDRHRHAFRFVSSVNEAANAHAADHVVGTVASLKTSPDGIIAMEVDVRGIDLDARNMAVARVERDLRTPALARVALGEPLPGSGDAPVDLDRRLVDMTLDTIERFGIGSVKSMFSAAGHDTQNAARAGVSSVMIFAQSKGGLAHNPNAYTSPANIEKAVRAQAALLLRLANEVPDF